jgi:hypothetical protein
MLFQFLEFANSEQPHIESTFLEFIKNPKTWRTSSSLSEEVVQKVLDKIVDVKSGLRFLLCVITMLCTKKGSIRALLDFFYVVRICSCYEPTMFDTIIQNQNLLFRDAIITMLRNIMDSQLSEFVSKTQDEQRKQVYIHWMRVGLHFLVSVLEDPKGTAVTPESQFHFLYKYVQKHNLVVNEGPLKVGQIHYKEIEVMNMIMPQGIRFLFVRPDLTLFEEFHAALSYLQISTPFDYYPEPEEDLVTGEFDKERVNPLTGRKYLPIGFMSKNFDDVNGFLTRFKCINSQLVSTSDALNDLRVSVYIENVPATFHMWKYKKHVQEICDIKNIEGVIFNIGNANKWKMHQLLFAITCSAYKGVLIRRVDDYSTEDLSTFVETLRVFCNYFDKKDDQ